MLQLHPSVLLLLSEAATLRISHHAATAVPDGPLGWLQTLANG